ncbi:MAG: EAL domain-containing protein [Deltaproteobacteria bacterium]|nr:EAL domain-containing protein [Deltaproteobacteria bacterium]
MEKSLAVLVLEDRPTDAELTRRALTRHGLEFEWVQVDTEPAFVAALERSWDVIIADYALPTYDGLSALRLVRSRGLDVPFIVVSGTVGDEAAAELIREGATDYLLKDRLARLGQAVLRALDERDAARREALAEEALRARERRFRALLEHGADGVAVVGQGGGLLYASPALERILGYGKDAWASLDLPTLIHEADRASLSPEFERLVGAHRSQARAELRVRHRDGAWLWIEAVATNMGDAAEVGGLVINFRDVTVRKRQEARIQRLSRTQAVLSGVNGTLMRIHERAAMLEESCRVAASTGDFDAVLILRRVRAMAPRVGTEPEPELRTATESALEPEPADALEVEIEAIAQSAHFAATTNQHVDVGTVFRSSSLLGDAMQRCVALGEPVVHRGVGWTADELSMIMLPLTVAAEVVGAIALFSSQQDFSDEDELRLLRELAGNVSFAVDYVQKSDRLHYLTQYDPVTDLPNRLLFEAQLAQALRMSEEGAIPVVLIGMDGLLAVADTFGLIGQDQVNADAAQKLRSSVDSRHLLAAVGPGQFAIAFVGAPSEVELRRAIDEILRPLSGPYSVDEASFRLSVRAGAALFPDDALDAASIIRCAETALHRAQESNELCLFYAHDMNGRVSRRLSLESRLRRSIEQGEFLLHYQPKFDARTGTVKGLEALLRWDAPDEGMVLPSSFIPALEETGLIVEVGRWAIERARGDFSDWLAKGFRPPRVAVNVSNVQLKRKDFVESVIDLHERLPNPWLDLEITESMLIDDIDAGIAKIRALSEAGIPVAIDDFGTGYSSLSCIGRLPVGSLKIDRSFVVNMTDSPGDMAIVTSVIALAHALGLRVIAEGVDTDEQAKLLRLLRCDEMQGFLFSRPLPPTGIESMMAIGRGGSKNETIDN